MSFLGKLYHLLLNLYPREFLDEFQEELQAVFELSLQEAAEKGKFELLRVAVREFSNLPGAILHEHTRSRRRNTMGRNVGTRFEFPPGSISEAFAALAPLLLIIGAIVGMPALLSFIGQRSGWLVDVLGYLLVGSFFILLLVGLVKGLPRWTMPYLGFLLALFSVYNFSEILYAYYGFYHLYERPWILEEFYYQLHMWSGLTLVVVFLVLASAVFPVFHRFRRDWTLLSLLVYGAVPFALLLAFEEYQLKDPYLLLVFVVQAIGIWFYLSVHGKWKRFWILFCALTLSVWIVAVSKMILLSSQSWFRGQIPDWENEMLVAFPMWVWLSLTMLIPSLISFFPRVRKPTLAN